MPTTIKLKNSVTTTNAPSSLAQGEVAINVTDKKVWVGNAATTPVQIVGTGAGGGAAAGSNTQVQFNSSGALAGSANLTFNGTTLVANDITDSSLTANRVVYAGTAGNLVNSANFTFNGTTATLANDASISGLTVGKGVGSAASNTAVGASALSGGSQTGIENTAVGSNSLLSNTTGNSNSAVGERAMRLNTTGSQNTAFGSFSLATNTTGSFHVAVGREALAANTTGSNNTAIGLQALQANTTASNNTAVGYQAGYTNTTGANNTFLGWQAGYSNNANNNTFVGLQAGYGVTSGTQNTIIGPYVAGVGGAGAVMTTGSKNTIIGGYSGNQGGLDIRTASNYIVLSDGDGNPRGYFDNNGRFIVGGTGANGRVSIIDSTDGGVALSFAFGANSGLGMEAQCTGASFNGIAIRSRVSRNTTNGSFQAFGYYNDGAGAYRMYVQDSGNLQNANNSYGGISDIKLKENIVDATPKLDKLMQVKVRNYNLKADQTHKQIGVIAQELEEVFPSLVEEFTDRDAEGNDLGTATKTVKYSVFVPMLIKAVQELNAKVEAQALEIAQLKGN